MDEISNIPLMSMIGTTCIRVKVLIALHAYSHYELIVIIVNNSYIDDFINDATLDIICTINIF